MPNLIYVLYLNKHLSRVQLSVLNKNQDFFSVADDKIFKQVGRCFRSHKTGFGHLATQKKIRHPFPPFFCSHRRNKRSNIKSCSTRNKNGVREKWRGSRRKKKFYRRERTFGCGEIRLGFPFLSIWFHFSRLFFSNKFFFLLEKTFFPLLICPRIREKEKGEFFLGNHFVDTVHLIGRGYLFILHDIIDLGRNPLK